MLSLKLETLTMIRLLAAKCRYSRKSIDAQKSYSQQKNNSNVKK